MSVTKIASRYAKSLIDLASEAGKLETIYGDITGFKEAIGNRDLYLLVKSPIIKADKKQSIFKAIFGGKADELTIAFFDIMIKKGREQYLPEIADQVITQYNVLKGVTSATVITATELTTEHSEAIKKQLATMGVSGGRIELETKIDPSIIGGFILEVGDKLYDASVKSKLAGLKKEILDNSHIKSL